MRIRRRIWWVFVGLALVPGVTWSAELTTEAERTYRDLQRSKLAKDQLLAERWYNLIRQQQWEDASGKHTTVAKYVEHDPDLQWVKLRVIRGTGANRVVKDVEIPLAKLSKTCQSRVRQIAFLKERVATAAIEAAKEPAAGDAAGPMQDGGDRVGERGQSQLPAEDPRATAAPPEQSPPVAESMPRPPLPARLPPLPSDAGLAWTHLSPSPQADSRTRDDQPASPADGGVPPAETSPPSSDSEGG